MPSPSKWATSTSVSFMPFGSFKILCKNRLQLCNVLVGNVFLVTLASFLMTSFDLIVNPIFPLTILIAEHFFRACILIVHIDVPKVLYQLVVYGSPWHMIVHESGQCGDIRKKQRSLSCFNTFQPKSEPNSKTTKYFVAFLLASLLTKYKGLKSVSESSSFL